MTTFLERAVELFGELCDLERDEQTRRVAAISAEAPELGAKVARMLEDDRHPDGRLERDVVERIGADLIASDSVAVSPEELERLADRGRFSHYQVKGEVARGGMGSIYEIWDGDLERPLAMKVVEQNGEVHSDRLRRFLNEARVTGQLDHPGIVPVHEMGIDSAGRAYFTMKLVTGCTLGEVFGLVARGAEGWNQTRAVGVLLRVCEAMAYAHHKSVVHRDLKPDNVMVGRMGEVYVMDWGVARVRGSENGRDLRPQEPVGRVRLQSPVMTMDGVVVGTPYYMSPEQARGEEVDERSDVFAVGALLYTLLAGHAPYQTSDRSGEQATPHGVLAAVRSGPPRSLQALGHKAPIELEAICEKAMQREPAERYASMIELRDDLKAFLEERVVRAYETGAGAEFKKWVLRNRGMATSLGAAIVLALGGLTAVTLIQDRSNQLLAAQNEEAVRNAYVSDVIAAGLILDSSLASARRRLQRCPEKLKNWEWYHLDVRQDTSLFTLPHEGIVSTLVISPDGNRFASAAERGVRVWNAATGELVTTLDMEGSSPNAIDFSPDGRQIVTGAEDGSVQTWDARTGAAIHRLVADDQRCTTVAYSPDGRLVAAGGNGRMVRIWNATSGEAWAQLAGHTDFVRTLAFSHDGSWLASASYDHSVRLWDVEERRLHGSPMAGHSATVDSLAFHPDDTIIASGCYDGTVRTWRTRDTTPIHAYEGHLNQVLDIAFSPDGTRLASGSDDKTVRIWNVADGRGEHTLPHTAKVPSIAYSMDGSRLVAADGKSISLWNTETGLKISVLRGHDEPIQKVAFGLDERRIVSCSGDGTARIWLSATEDGFATLSAHDNWIQSVVYSPDGNRIASGSQDKTVRVWDVRSGEHRTLKGHTGTVYCVAFSPGGERIASGSHDQTVRLWDTATGECLGAPLDHEEPVRAVAFAPRGEVFVTGSQDGRVRIWEGSTCRATLEGHTGPVQCIAFSRDGSRIFSGSRDGTIRVWDVASARTVATLEDGAGAVTSVATHPDGVLLLSGSERGKVQLWDPARPDPLMVLQENNLVSAVAFNADGSRIASGSYDKTVRLWDTQTGDPVGLLEHRDVVAALAWSPDGARIASGSLNDLRIWDSDLGSALELWGARSR